MVTAIPYDWPYINVQNRDTLFYCINWEYGIQIAVGPGNKQGAMEEN